MPFAKNPGAFTEAEIDDEVVLLNIATGQFQALKGVALTIWRLLDADGDPAAIKRALIERYDVDAATCDAEVDRFIHELVQAHLVVVR